MRLSASLIVLSACISLAWCFRPKAPTIHDAVKAINENDYKFAEKIIPKQNNQNEITTIVQASYKDNFNLLITFVKALDDVNIAFSILNTLYAEMERNSYPNKKQYVYQLIEIVNTIESKITCPTCGASQPIAQNLIKTIVKSIKARSIEVFETALKENEFEIESSRLDLDMFMNVIHAFQRRLSKDIMQRVISDGYEGVKIKSLLDYVSLYELDLKILGMQTIFEKAYDAKKLNSDDSLYLAFCLHRIQEDENFTQLSKEQQSVVYELINTLSPCARNLFFQPTFCIWNRGKDEFIYAADSNYNFDSERRSIFSRKHLLAGAKWRLERNENSFFFENIKYQNEHFYAAGTSVKGKKNFRHVFNWIDGYNNDEQDAWNVEIDGDYCYLKSVYFKEYLYASDLTHAKDNTLRYVCTGKPATTVRGPEFQWQIRAC